MKFRFVKLAAVLAVFFLFPLSLAAEETPAPNFPAYSRMIDVPEVGELHYYAQNDPQWASFFYEPFKSEKLRTMRSSGCGPTAAAMAIRKQLSPEELPLLLEAAKNPERGFPFCPCSVNTYRCAGEHEQISPATPEEFEEWLPVIFANLATGNNRRRALLRGKESPTSIALFGVLADFYGLDYRTYATWDEAAAALRAGSSIITTVTEGIFTSSSHFLFLCGISDEYLYIFDPLMRGEYPADKKHLVEVLEPGLLRVKLENVKHIYLYGFYAFSRPEASPGEALMPRK